MTSPVPGFAAPAPRTWAKSDPITAPRLRDVTNLANLFTVARPMFWAFDGSNSTLANGADAVEWTFTETDNWNTNVLPASPGATPWQAPLAGWYLVQGNIGISSTSTNGRLGMGFSAVINGNGAAEFNAGSGPTVTTGTPPAGHGACGGTGADLFQFNPATSDSVQWLALLANGTPAALTSFNSGFAEWVTLPTSGLTSYTGPYGTVVSSPVFAAAFPPGPGTTLAAPVSAGATSITVASSTGMVTGGALGLDFLSGTQFSPVAEAVSITSVAGTTIGISAAAFAHSSGAPVAVPYSAAFLNQQVRDAINYLVYPPFCRLQCSAGQTIASTAFPPTVGGNPGNQIIHFTAGGVTGQPSADNFSATSTTAFTAPVGGLYFVYGQVSLAGATAVYAAGAGLSVNGGTIQWGTLFRAAGGVADTMCPTITRHLRLTAGQTVTLWAYQGSGSNMSTNSSTADNSRLICLWRGQ